MKKTPAPKAVPRLRLLLLLSLLSLSPAAARPAWAAEPAADGNSISQERLTDATIEYDEIGSLIRANNIDIQNLLSGTSRSRQIYTENRDSLQIEREDAAQKKEEAEDDGDTEHYTEYAALEQTYRSGIRSYNSMLKKLDRPYADRSRVQLEKELCRNAQNLMISHESGVLQEEILSAREEVLKTEYENAVLRHQQGLLSESETEAAKNAWTAAVNSRQQHQDSQKELRQALCHLLGTDEDGSIEIAKIPPADESQIPQMDPQKDLQQAIANNYEIIEQRRTSAQGTPAINNKKRGLEETKQQISIALQTLSETVRQAQAACRTAETSYENASRRWEGAQQKYTMGMISKAEYQREALSYTEKRTGLKAANLQLLQAMESYQWALSGIIDLS